VREFFSSPRYLSDRGPSTAARMARYMQFAPLMGESASRRALRQTNTAPETITHLITVSCTGLAAPGLDTSLILSLGLRPDVRRLHVGFMGCHAAFNALGAACDAVMADESATVLVCCVELCSLHLSYGWNPGRSVANALFSDGAAAAVIAGAQRAAAGTWRLCDLASLLLPDSLDAMSWHIGNHGFEMTLSPRVPGLIGQHLGGWCERWLSRHNLRMEDIAGWAVHPGGPKVLSAVSAALNLEPDALRHSRDVLSRHGNMSSATVLFILQQMAAQNLRGPCVAIGLGPGLMAEGMLLKC
jgi:predicted naringenin-chalcone synthase